MHLQEHFFMCPYCWQEISFLIDPSQENGNYVEDCQVCCNPIEINYQCEEGQIVYFEAMILGQ